MSVWDVLISLNYLLFRLFWGRSLPICYPSGSGIMALDIPVETLRKFVVEQVLSCVYQKHSQVSLSKPSKFPKDKGLLVSVRSWVTHRKVTLGERPKGVTTCRSSRYVCVSSGTYAPHSG